MTTSPRPRRGRPHHPVRRTVMAIAAALGLVAATVAAIASTAAAATPSIDEQQKLTASDAAAGDRLGRSIAIDGDTMLVGAWTDDHAGGVDAGAVYVFVNDGSSWVEQTKLTASDAAAGDQFGVEAAIDGDTVVIGSFRDDDDGADSGSAYIFQRTGTTWNEQAKLTASDAAAGDEFGHTVRLSGDTVLVGVWNDDDDGADSGSAYIFQRTGTTWNEQAKLTASDAAAGDQFGIAVAIDGDTAAIGSWRDDHGGADAGSAYVYQRTGTTWNEQAKLVPSTPGADDRFGGRMAVSGDTVLVGAWRDDDQGENSGSAYIFQRTGTAWSEQQKLLPSDGAARDAFGLAAALVGDTVVITAWRDDDGANDAGSAYVFTRTGTTWTEQTKLGASDPGSGDRFGVRAGLSGSTAVVGAWEDDDDGADSGSAYVFDIGGSPPPPPPPPPGRGFPAGAAVTVLDGVSLRQQGTTLQINGSGSADELYLTQFDGSIQVGISDGNGDWDGRSYPAAQVRSVRVNTGNGDDTVHLGDASTPGHTDTITPLVQVDLGNDADQLLAAGVILDRRTTIRLGRGDDEMTANGAAFDGGLLVTGSTTADTVSLIDVDVTGRTTINGSSGDDELTIRGGDFNGRMTVNLAAGANRTDIDETTIRGGLLVRGGSQVDTVELGDVSLPSGVATISTGSGADDIEVNANRGSLRVIAGNGDDDVTVGPLAVAGAALNLNLGGGNDTMAVSVAADGGQPLAGGTFTANGSSGTDTADVTFDPSLTEAQVLAELRLIGFETVSTGSP